MVSSGIMFELTLKFRTGPNCVDFSLPMCLFICREFGPDGGSTPNIGYTTAVHFGGARNGAKLESR